MGEGDSLSDQVQRLLQEIEVRNENRWKRDIRNMFEEVLNRTLEGVLTRKLSEVGIVASRPIMKEDRDHGDSLSPRRNIRSWTAEQVVRTLECAQSASSLSESMLSSVSGVERSSCADVVKVDFEGVVPSCTATQDCGVVEHPPDKESHSAIEPTHKVILPQSTDTEAPIAKEHMSVVSSSTSVRDVNNKMIDSAHDNNLGIKCPPHSRIGAVSSMAGYIPRAWDSSSRSDRAYKCAKSFGSSQSWSSFVSDPQEHISYVGKMLTRTAMSQRLPARFENSSFFQLLCATVVMNQRFDFAVCIVILANAASMGVSADFQAHHVTDAEPSATMFLEKVFLSFFLVELMLRLNVYRRHFFHGPGCSWNIFDFIVVGSQVLEDILSFVGSGSQTFGLSGVLRLLRLVRVIRLARILRLIRELRVLVSSISNSMKSLVWTLILMCLMIYSVSLCITQLVTDKRLSIKSAGGSENEALDLYYGSLSRCMLSLFEAITGGVDWDIVATPLLQEVHPLLALVFVLYIAIALLAIMNVVTGVFVDSVLASARADKEHYLLNNAKQLFTTVEEEMDWETFKGKMDTPQMLEFFKGIDVDPSEAKNIFSLIDLDQSGSINADEFLTGCVRLHGPSKAIETAVLLQEFRNLRRDMARIEKSMAH